MLLNDTLKALGIRNLNYRPCLVQHIDGLSLLTGIIYNRQSIYFKDYLDELGIKYDDAFKVENRERLKELLEKDKIKWAEMKRLNGYK
jgi:hypothetical protein